MSALNQLWRLCFISSVAVSLSFFASGCNSEKRTLPQPKLTAEEQRGRRLFAANCAACHESQTSSARQGPSMKGIYRRPSLPSGAPANDERVRDAILLGRRDMPAYQDAFTDDQVKAVIAYLHTL